MSCFFHPNLNLILYFQFDNFHVIFCSHKTSSNLDYHLTLVFQSSIPIKAEEKADTSEEKELSFEERKANDWMRMNSPNTSQSQINEGKLLLFLLIFCHSNLNTK